MCVAEDSGVDDAHAPNTSIADKVDAKDVA